MKWLPAARGIGGIVLFLALWEATVRFGWLQYEYLPAPSVILSGLVTLGAGTEVYGELAHTISATLEGWAMAVVLGLILGVLLGLSATVRAYSLTTIEVLRPVPAIALVPIALLLFGFSLKTELFVIVLPCTWPVLINTMAGIQSVPPRLRDVAEVLHLGRHATVTKVLVPAAATGVLVGCRLSISLAIVLAIISEMIGNPHGLGNAIIRESEALRPDLMFAYIFITGLLGIVLNACLVQVAKLLLPGEFMRPAAAMRGLQ